LTGTADTPDVPASPIAAATSIANKVVRIVMSPPVVTFVAHVRSSSFAPPMCVLPMPSKAILLSADAIVIKSNRSQLKLSASGH
jgi:hypothetical protein